MNGEEKERQYCSFCGKSDHDVEAMVVGPCVSICFDCVDLCMDFVRDHRKSAATHTQK